MNLESAVRVFAVAAAVALAGCLTRGSVEEHPPKVVDKLPATARVFVATDDKPGAKTLYERRARAVAAALNDALAARGVAVAAGEKSADFAVRMQIVSWEYNDAGFSGFGDRDDVTVELVVENLKTRRVFSRATVRVKSDFAIFRKYVERIWEDGSRPVKGAK